MEQKIAPVSKEDIILNKLRNIEQRLNDVNVKPLGFNEAAKYLGMSKSYLYKLTCKHSIPHYKPTGKRIFFDVLDLNNWIKQNPVGY